MSNRRDFLKTVLIGTGSVFLVPINGCDKPASLVRNGQLDIHKQSQHFRVAHRYLREKATLGNPDKVIKADVAIVGGGFAGLAAAHTLLKAGIEVIVVDSEPRLGGTAVSTIISGKSIPLGSVYYVAPDETINELISLAGLEAIPCPTDAIECHGQLMRDIWNDDVLKCITSSQRDLEGIRRFRDEVLAMEDRIPEYPLPFTLDSELAALDAQTAADYIQEYNSPTLEVLLDAYCRSSMGAGIRTVNAYSLLNFYSSEFGPSFSRHRYTIPGGLGALTAGIQKTLAYIFLNETAVNIKNVQDGVEIITIEAGGEITLIECKQCIAAVGKFQMPRLLPDLPSQQVEAISKLMYAPYLTAHIESDLPIIPHDVFDLWNMNPVLPFSDVVNPMSILPEANPPYIASVFTPMVAVQRPVLENESDMAATIASTVNGFLSSRPDIIRNSVRSVHGWAWGHSIVVPTTGSHNGIAQTASMPFGNVLFANTDNDASPSIESAIHHGVDAAHKIIQLRKPRQ